MASETNYKSPSATGDDYTDWSDPTNAYSSDDTYAVATGNQQQDWYDFSFDIPSSATIEGIEIEFEDKTSYSTAELACELSWDGGSNYTFDEKSHDWESTDTEETHTLGGSTDTWGRSWTVDELSNTNFRVRLESLNDSEETISVDHFQVKIYYSLGITDFNKKKKLDVVDKSGDPTISRTVPIKIKGNDDSTTGTGEIELDWTNISSESDIAVYDENANLLDYYFESFDATNETAVIHVYRDWVRDGSTQLQIAYGDGPSDQSVSADTVFDNETDLEGGWLLNEDSGDALDVTSNNNNGTLNGGVTQGVTGQIDGAYDLDGDDSYVEFPDKQEWKELNGRNLTARLWIKTTDTLSDNQGVLGTYSTLTGGCPNPDQFWIVQINEGHLSGQIRVDDEGDEALTSESSDIADGNWHLVEFVKDGTTITLYVDNSEVGSASLSSEGDTDNEEKLRLGVHYDRYLDYVCDNVQIFSSASSSDDRTALYDSTKSSPDFFSQQAGESTEEEANSEREVELTGQQLANTERSIELTGILKTEREIEITGEDTRTTERETELSGVLKANTERGVELAGRKFGISIGDEDATLKVEWSNFTINDNLYEEVDTCRFSTKDYKPSVGDEIVVTDGGDKIFAGFIAKVRKDRRTNVFNEFRITAKDYTAWVNKRRPAESYEDETIENIIADLQSEYLPEFTLENVDATTTLDSFIADREMMGEIFNKLADKINYNWYIDYDKGIHFFDQGEEVGPKVTETNGNLINNTLQVTEDISQLKNRVFVEGGKQITDYERSEYFTAEGSNETFDLASKFASEPTVLLDGTEQNVGLENLDNDSDYDVMWNYQQKYIKFTTTPSDGDSIEVKGEIELPVVVQVEDAASVDEHGVHEFKITDKKLRSTDDAKKRAQKELQAYAQELTEASFESRNPDFKSGQKITLDAEGVEGEYIVQGVKRKADGPESFVYDIDLATTRTLGVIRFMQKLLKAEEDQQEVDKNKVLRLYYQDNQVVEVQEDISLGVEKEDYQTVTVNEVIENNPDIYWVYAPYFPSSDSDDARPARYDRGIPYA